MKNCSSWINLIVTSCLRFFFHTPLVLLISGVFVRWWKGVNHFIFLSNALTSEQNFHIVPHWVGFWKFIGVQPSQKIRTLVVPISFHFMRKRPGVKESSIDRVKLDSSFCVLMSPWRWQQEKFIKWYSMHLSDLVRLNSTTTTKKFSLWRGHCWF